jgi:ribosome-associated protein
LGSTIEFLLFREKTLTAQRSLESMTRGFLAQAPRHAASAVVRYPQERVLTKAHLPGTNAAEPAAPSWLIAARAAESKKATDILVLDLSGITSFADFFLICTGANQRQIQAISDEIGLQLKRQAGELPISVEGYNQAEWVLADYGDTLIHVFSPKSREYYGLERLWRHGRKVEVPPDTPPRSQGTPG